MFSEVLKIKPKLDNGDLNSMDRALSKRFQNIAKKFGKGLVGALAGGGLAGIGLGLIDKLLNPLKEVQESIDRTLKQADDLLTFSQRFGTTSGKLFKLEQAGVATGLESGTLFMMLEKFQSTIAEAKADPTKQTSVRQFVDMPDIAESFLLFIQNMQKLAPDQRVLVENEVFGERLLLKAADFVQSDFKKLFLQMNARDSEYYTQRINKLGELADNTDILTGRRNLKDLESKASLLSNANVKARDTQLNMELKKENQRIGNYQGLMQLSMAVDKTLNKIEAEILPALNSIAPALQKLGTLVDKIPTMRGLKGMFDGKGN